jgi:hypothetical protein
VRFLYWGLLLSFWLHVRMRPPQGYSACGTVLPRKGSFIQNCGRARASDPPKQLLDTRREAYFLVKDLDRRRDSSWTAGWLTHEVLPR